MKVIGRFLWGRSLILSLLSAAIVYPTSWTGKVVGVSDGDTFSVMHEGKAIKIRLHGVDCPETAQPFGTKAKQFASSLVFGQDVRVDPVERDRYGRLVATLHMQDGRVLNHELVRHGFAWWYKQYAPGDTVLPRLENEAREGRIGLWADDAPIPPWNWRKGEREKRVGEPAAPRGPPDANAHQKPEFSQGTETTAHEIVYRTNTGKKYHRDGCRYLKSRIPTTASNASAMGLAPCSSCNPPSAAASLGRSEAPRTTTPRAPRHPIQDAVKPPPKKALSASEALPAACTAGSTEAKAKNSLCRFPPHVSRVAQKGFFAPPSLLSYRLF